jgi:hypothetical protein
MPICIETYLGLGSVLYNAHEWGYDKKRRGYVGMFKCDTLIPESDLKLDEGDEYVDDGGEGEEKVADRSFHCSRDDSPGHTDDYSANTSQLLSACGQPRQSCLPSNKPRSLFDKRITERRSKQKRPTSPSAVLFSGRKSTTKSQQPNIEE